MKRIAGSLLISFTVMATALMPMALFAQGRGQQAPGLPTKTTYVPLQGGNAVLVELAQQDPVRSKIGVIVIHPEHANNFNYFTGRELAQRGYRAMMVNYYGPERSFYEFITPLASAVKAMRAVPGIEKVVLVGHSSGGPVLASYQNIAENGAKACQQPERVFKCDGKNPNVENLPKADAIMMIDSAAGAPERTDALNPAVDAHNPRIFNAAIDMFNPKNGYDAATKAAAYSPDFLKKFFAAQAARSTQLIDEASARLAKIEKGEGMFKEDEPFVVAGSTVGINGSRPQLADVRLLSKSHAPHMLLKADGTKPVTIIPQVMPPEASAENQASLYQGTLDFTVKYYLSFQALRVTPDYHMTEDNIYGIDWRSTPNSVPGEVEGVKVPSLFLSGTCAPHVVYLEIAYEHSAAKDKDFVGVEGALHGLTPCKPEYGDTFKRSFDYMDSWLLKPGRL
jgi:pimeloyl-ACP methyl ester carboxylesterase